MITSLSRHAVTSAQDIIDALYSMRNDAQSKILSRFFKTDKGEYGEGDKFLGLKVPQTRMVVKEARLSVSRAEIQKLLYSEWHEVRLCGFLLLAEEMKVALPKRSGHGMPERRDEIARFYLDHARQANNWDLVDFSCGYIVGNWLLYPTASGAMADRHILDHLAISANLWEQRIAIVSTSMLIRNGQFDDTLRIAETLLNHPHDLIHKAVGWMLREMGKKDIALLRTFLAKHHATMPRTTLRYAIERMDEEERGYWMNRQA